MGDKGWHGGAVGLAPLPSAKSALRRALQATGGASRCQPFDCKLPG